MKDPFISVIIPTYNRCKYLSITIDSFLKQSYPSDMFEIIVVDNSSTDDTSKLLKSYNDSYPDKVKILFEARQGVHYARNSAAKFAKGELLYFTDDDMIADSDLLKEIVKPFGIDEKVGTATGRVLPKWEAEPPKWVLRYCINGLLSLSNPIYEFLISANDCQVYSCHQAILKDIFLKAGGYNPENTKGEWIGDGETGLNIKVKDLGYKFAFNGKSIIHHIIPASRMTQAYLNKRFSNQGNCDSYSAFKKHQFTKRQLQQNVITFYIKGFLQLLKGAIQFVFLRPSWRINLARAYYYYSRIKYDRKLIESAVWRQFVLKYDWANE